MKKNKKMDIETAGCIQNAFFEVSGIFIKIFDIRKMRRIPSELNSELYSICLLKNEEEVMYVAKIHRVDGRITKVNIAEHPPIRDYAREYCKEQKEGE